MSQNSPFVPGNIWELEARSLFPEAYEDSPGQVPPIVIFADQEVDVATRPSFQIQ